MVIEWWSNSNVLRTSTCSIHGDGLRLEGGDPWCGERACLLALWRGDRGRRRGGVELPAGRVEAGDLDLRADELAAERGDGVAGRKASDDAHVAVGGEVLLAHHRLPAALVLGGAAPERSRADGAEEVETALGQRARLVKGGEPDLAADGDALRVDAKHAARLEARGGDGLAGDERDGQQWVEDLRACSQRGW